MCALNVEKLKVTLFCFFSFVKGSCIAEASSELLILPPPMQYWDHRPVLPHLAFKAIVKNSKIRVAERKPGTTPISHGCCSRNSVEP